MSTGSLKESFILELSERLTDDGIDSNIAYKIAVSVVSEYIGQPIKPLVDYYKKVHGA